MKITLAKLEEINSAFAGTPVKGESNLTVALNLMVLNPHIKAINDSRDSLIKQYSNGAKNLTNSDPNWEAFWTDFTTILKTEIEIPDLRPLKRTDLNFDKEQNQNHLMILLYYKLLDGI